MRAIALVLGGHHPLTLCGLSQVFGQHADFAVVAVCSHTADIVDAVRVHHPDIVILDLDRNEVFKALRRIHREHRSTRVVVLSSASENGEMLDAVGFGAHAIVLKELPPEALVTCIRKVYEAVEPLDGHHVDRVTAKLVRGGPSTRHTRRQLTPREAEIARLAVHGVSTKEIAERLDVKQGTVKIHLHSIYEKLHVGGRLGLILAARRHGLA